MIRICKHTFATTRGPGAIDPSRMRCVDLCRMSAASRFLPHLHRGSFLLQSALFLLAVAAAVAAHAQDKGPATLEVKLSTAVAPAFPLGAAGERWALLINEKAAGAFDVRQYAGATLASRDPGREFGALKDGATDLAVGSALAWSAQFPPLAIYATPWLAGDAAEQAALVASADVRAQLFARMADAGVVALAVAPLGERVLATMTGPVDTPAACKGLRVRVLSLRPVVDVYLGLGALPRAMGYAEAQAAFAGGGLDGQDAMPSVLAASHAYASGQKFVTLWGAFADVMVFAVRKSVWDAWPEERRVLVRAAAVQTAREANAPAREEAALAELTQQGVTIVRLSSIQRAALRVAAEAALAAWKAAVGAELVAAAEAAVAAARK
jgi:TRAP-type transport system periplasmic protein